MSQPAVWVCSACGTVLGAYLERTIRWRLDRIRAMEGTRHGALLVQCVCGATKVWRPRGQAAPVVR